MVLKNLHHMGTRMYDGPEKPAPHGKGMNDSQKKNIAPLKMNDLQVSLVMPEKLHTAMRGVGSICGYMVQLELKRKGLFKESEMKHNTLNRTTTAIDSYKYHNNIFEVVSPPTKIPKRYVVAVITSIKEVNGSRLAESAEEAKEHLKIIYPTKTSPISERLIQERIASNKSFLKFLHKPVLVINTDSEVQFQLRQLHALALYTLNGMEITSTLDNIYEIHNPKWDERSAIFTDRTISYSNFYYILHRIQPQIENRVLLFGKGFIKLTANAGAGAFTVDMESFRHLSSMTFHLQSGNHIEDLDEVDFSTQEARLKIRWPNAAKYYVTRRVWMFCQIETAPLQFPEKIIFKAYWRDFVPFFEIHATRVEENTLSYQLNVFTRKVQTGTITAKNSLTQHQHPICNMYACIWDDTTKYSELALRNVGSTGPQRLFRTDGCSYEAVNQFGNSCWFVSVSTLLSKIEPIYNDLSKIPALKKWLDHDRSALTNDQNSCLPHILPARIYEIYNEVDKYLESFDFGENGGFSCKLLKSVFQYYKEYMRHLGDEAVESKQFKVAATSHLMANRYKIIDVNSSVITPEFISSFKVPVTKDNHLFHVTIWKGFQLETHLVIHAIKTHSNLLGGILNLRSHSVPFTVGSHSVPFTMCDGHPIICTWGSCRKDRTKSGNIPLLKELELDNLVINRMELIFAEGIKQPKQKRKQTTVQLILRNPMNTIHLYTKVDLTQQIKQIDKQFSFVGTVTNIKHEFDETGDLKGISNTMGDMLNTDVRWVTSDVDSMQYRTVNQNSPIKFASKTILPSGDRKYVSYFIGDIHSSLLKIYLLKFVTLHFKDFKMIIELKSQRHYHAIVHHLTEHKGNLDVGMPLFMTHVPHDSTNDRQHYKVRSAVFSGSCTMSGYDHHSRMCAFAQKPE